MKKQGSAVFSFLAIYVWFFSTFPCRNNDTFWNQNDDRKSSHCSFLFYRFCSRKLWYEKEFGVAGNLSLLKRSRDLKVSSCVRCKKHEILQAEKHKVISLDQIYGLWGCELKAADDIALICSQTKARIVSVHLCPMHRPWRLGINTSKERVCLEQRSAHEILTVSKKCVFICFPRKWLSISYLAEFTILDRLTTAILSLPNDQNKPNQNKKNFFWRYLISTNCLIYIWPKFCVLRLLTIYSVADNVHRVLPFQRGKRKSLYIRSLTCAGVMPEISGKSGFVLTWIS